MATTAPQIPRRVITTEDDLRDWTASAERETLVGFARDVGDAIIGKVCSNDLASSAASRVLLTLLEKARDLVSEFPPQDAHQRARYGNPSYKDWFDAMSATALGDMLSFVTTAAAPSADPKSLAEELSGYWRDSFGNRNRVDYGTGHEVAFATLCLCARKAGVLDSESDMVALGCAVFPAYLRAVRRIQSAYLLEPAGSHGVWCVDDFHFLPFYWGAAQLQGHPHLKPKSALDPDVVAVYADGYLYLDAVRHVRNTKAKLCSVEEACPILCDISRLAKTWVTARQGLARLWTHEVLDKLPVAQHFLFSAHFDFRPSGQGQAQAQAGGSDGGHQDAAAGKSEWRGGDVTAMPGAETGAAPGARVSLVALVHQLFGEPKAGDSGWAGAGAGATERGGGLDATARAQRWAALESTAAELRASGTTCGANDPGARARMEGAPSGAGAHLLRGPGAAPGPSRNAIPDPSARVATVAPAPTPVALGPEMVTATAPGVDFSLDPGDAGIRLKGWHIHASKLPLADAGELAALQEALGHGFKLPEMIFARNHLTLDCGGGELGDGAPPALRIRLSAKDALWGCALRAGARAHPDPHAPAPALIKLPAAERWSERLRRLAEQHDHVDAETPREDASDWTFSTTYRGTVTRSRAHAADAVASTGEVAEVPARDDSARVDYDLLRRRDPILWHEEVTLFESELDDNGVASLTARVRVMPTAWFVLMRFWLRVDGVLVRLYDTRLFYEFGAPAVVVEYCMREDTFEALEARGMPRAPTAYLDPAPIAERLRLVAKFHETVQVPSAASTAPRALD